mmetsp:Transcript_43748/g.93663  ORF Transcript_43748/g.93663 Transcript_43748/m.93663 type:complete len:722 (+) Transcript_43748:275-2440(+)|eukprot:CAMPEP_0206442758 /NCGR_PEP_ID=MMETSP0324_2-20121206/13997_1 /ASSEMBLY_ACC=CAM_ASM_000836 /TAXON_ID=2866 /ORGANISM="Crypthecodinium cohnii, Strain Seligo" /LENGTH=721 /DNA_ID=CAMNT_0053910631 /DNA_START=212 /DNA_END=2377 /DNA_ORIENTATION=-
MAPKPKVFIGGILLCLFLSLLLSPSSAESREGGAAAAAAENAFAPSAPPLRFLASTASEKHEILNRTNAQVRGLENINGFEWALKLHETCKTPIVTVEDCEKAAKAMGLWSGKAEIDSQPGVDHDPPFCYLEYDDSRTVGVLKFNPQGTNSGTCNHYDRCVCQCRENKPGRWVMGNPGETCTATCSRNNRRCSVSAMRAHNHDVDSEKGMAAVVRSLGHECKAYSTDFGAMPDVPVYNPVEGKCYFSQPERDEGSFDCNKVAPDGEQKSRLCYCDEDEDRHDICPTALTVTSAVVAGPVCEKCAEAATMPAPPCPIIARPTPVPPPAQPLPPVVPPPRPQPKPTPVPPPVSPAPPPAQPATTPAPQMPCSREAARAALLAATEAFKRNEDSDQIHHIAVAAAIAAGCGKEDAERQAITVTKYVHVHNVQNVQTIHHTSFSLDWWPLLLASAASLLLLGLCCFLCNKRFRFKIHHHGREGGRSMDYDESQALMSDVGTARREWTHTSNMSQDGFHVEYDQHAVAGAGAYYNNSYGYENFPAPRFGNGAMVKCHINGHWRSGQVVRHWWRDESWPSGDYVPYVIRLDDGQHCCAPLDDDTCIRLLDEPSPGHRQQQVQHMGAGNGVFHHTEHHSMSTPRQNEGYLTSGGAGGGGGYNNSSGNGYSYSYSNDARGVAGVSGRGNSRSGGGGSYSYHTSGGGYRSGSSSPRVNVPEERGMHRYAR